MLAWSVTFALWLAHSISIRVRVRQVLLGRDHVTAMVTGDSAAPRAAVRRVGGAGVVSVIDMVSSFVFRLRLSVRFAFAIMDAESAGVAPIV